MPKINHQQKFWVTAENMKQESPKIRAALTELVSAGGCQVILDKRPEKRRDIQNRLVHVFNGQIAKESGLDVGYSWGVLKLDLLLPIKNSSTLYHKEAEKEHIIVVHAAKYLIQQQKQLSEDHEKLSYREIMIECAEEYIRSKDIDLEIFSEFIGAIQRYGAEAGIALQSNKEDLLIAMGDIKIGQRGKSIDNKYKK